MELAGAAEPDLPGCPGVELHGSLFALELPPCQWNHHPSAPPPALASTEFRGSRLREDRVMPVMDSGGLAKPAKAPPYTHSEPPKETRGD